MVERLLMHHRTRHGSTCGAMLVLVSLIVIGALFIQHPSGLAVEHAGLPENAAQASGAADSAHQAVADSTSGSFWTIGDEANDFCSAQSPLLRLGGADLRAFPLPLFLEEHGWDAGGFASVEYPRGVTWAAVVSWSERQNRVGKRAMLSAALGDFSGWRMSTRIETFSRLGQQGIGAGLDMTLPRSASGGYMKIGLSATASRVSSLRYLGSRDWSEGDSREVSMVFEGEPQSEYSSHGTHAHWTLRSLVAGGALGGNFAYRQLLGRVLVWHGEWEGRFFAGVGDGRIPAQYLYDAGIEGRMMGIPIREFRGRGLRGVTFERRQRLLSELFVRTYGATAAVDGLDYPLMEWGVSISIEDPDTPMHPYGPMVRFDLPVYASHADHLNGARRKWDMRRFGFRLNFPWPSFAGRQEETRYRYPGR